MKRAQGLKLMNSLSLHTSATLHTTLSPRLQRAMRLLQLSSQDFAQAIRDALDTNPFLEQDDVPASGDGNLSSGANAEALPSHAETWGMDGVSRLRQGDGDAAAFDTLQARTSLAQHLVGQLNVMALSPRDLVLARAVAECLDDDGYLRRPTGRGRRRLVASTRARTRGAADRAAPRTGVDPAGVGARSVWNACSCN